MKIIHTSDWHIGQTLYNFDRADEHIHFFDALIDTLRREAPDALLVSGDVFNSAAPTIAARRLYVEQLLRLADAAPSTKIIVLAGNHDSGSRLQAESSLWLRAGIHIVGSLSSDGDRRAPVIEIPDKGHVVAVPYFHPSIAQFASRRGDGSVADSSQRSSLRDFFASLMPEFSDGLPVVMMAHLSLEKATVHGRNAPMDVGGIETVRVADIFSSDSAPDYLALGHIHKPQMIGIRSAYCGSPFPMSFDEDYTHYIYKVEIAERGDFPKVERVEMPILRRVRTIESCNLDSAIEELSAIDNDITDYVRLVIDTPHLLPATADDAARLVCADKACRFCGCFRKPSAVASATIDSMTGLETNEIRDFSPRDIGKRFLESRDLEEDDRTSLIKMLSSVIDDVEQTKSSVL